MFAETKGGGNIKELSIDYLGVAEFNLLMSIKGVRPEEITQQISPKINPIAWIFGHCASQMDFVFGSLCRGESILTEDQTTYFGYGAPKEKIKEGLPMPFRKLVDSYLSISDSSFSYLRKLPLEKFRQVPDHSSSFSINESLLQLIQRVSLHFMGHMGQIVIIRRALGNPGATFVGGIAKDRRERLLIDWKTWWEENKVKFV